MLNYPKQALAVIGLVLIGLLIGSMGTVWYLYQDTQSWSRPSSIESVQLGRPDINQSDRVPNVSDNGSDVPEADFSSVLATETLNQAFRSVAATVTPTVVFIEVEGTGGGNGIINRFDQGGLVQSVGSGVIVGKDGFVVTNNHVIDGARRIRVTLSDKREYAADLVGTDSDTDLAVLKLRSDETFHSIAFGDAEKLAVGEWVLAVGNPFRLTSTVTAGIVSAMGRSVDVINDRFGIESFIQTDAAINPGNSGGALVNLKGELIGIATAIATETGTYEGYGFAVPVNLMDRVVKDLIQYGSVQRGYLGVSIEEIDSRRAAALGLPKVQGVLLARVRNGLAAANAGLRPGDVLLSIEGKAVSAPNELQSVVALYRPGQELDAEVWRNGTLSTITIRLSGREDPQYESWVMDTEPDRMGQPGSPDMNDSAPVPDLNIQRYEDWGVGFGNLPDRFKARFGVENGIYIAYVEKEGPFYIAGVPGNTLLMEAGDVTIDSIESLEAAITSATELGEPIILKVRRQDGIMMFFEVSFTD